MRNPQSSTEPTDLNDEDDLVLTPSGGFNLHPETNGFVQAVIIGITAPRKTRTLSDEGECITFNLVFESELLDEGGEKYILKSKPYYHNVGKKLEENDGFRKDVETIRGCRLVGGKPINSSKRLLGHPLRIKVSHATNKNGKTYAYVTDIGPDNSNSHEAEWQIRPRA